MVLITLASINEPNSVIASPSISPGLQRRATAELLGDAGLPVTRAFLLALVSGVSPESSHAALLSGGFSGLR